VILPEGSHARADGRASVPASPAPASPGPADGAATDRDALLARALQEAADEAPLGPPLSAAEFEEMTAAVADRLHAAALRLCRNRADADDVVQDALLRAWRGIGTFRRGTRFDSWIFRILHNSFLNRRRHEVLAPQATDPDHLDPDARPETVPDLRSVGELPALADLHFDDCVKRAIERLPETFRVPFVLFSLGGLSYREIADATSAPIGTVMSRLHRARTLLRETLGVYARLERPRKRLA